MTPRLAEYVEAGKALDPDERLEAAHQLLRTLDQADGTAQSAVDEAWDKEIARRAQGIADGSVELVDGRASMARIRTELAAHRG
jgi:hypothetical protein